VNSNTALNKLPRKSIFDNDVILTPTFVVGR
jgi:hypothetical protein